MPKCSPVGEVAIELLKGEVALPEIYSGDGLYPGLYVETYPMATKCSAGKPQGYHGVSGHVLKAGISVNYSCKLGRILPAILTTTNL